MMLYSSNRNILKKGQHCTILECVDSAGSDEDKSSDISEAPQNFKDIIDHYNRGEIGGVDEELETSNCKSKK